MSEFSVALDVSKIMPQSAITNWTNGYKWACRKGWRLGYCIQEALCRKLFGFVIADINYSIWALLIGLPQTTEKIIFFVIYHKIIHLKHFRQNLLRNGWKKSKNLKVAETKKRWGVIAPIILCVCLCWIRIARKRSLRNAKIRPKMTLKKAKTIWQLKWNVS